MAENTTNVDEVVEAFVAIRDAREQAKAAFELADNKLKEQQDALKAVLLSVCNDMNVESLKTTHGLVMKQLKERFFSADWHNFGKFVVENQATDLYEKRIHQGNMKKYLEENADAGLPPGVNTSREYEIVVRRASGK